MTESDKLTDTERHAYVSSFTHAGSNDGDGLHLFRHPSKSAEVIRLFTEPKKEEKQRRNMWSKGGFTVINEIPEFLKDDEYTRSLFKSFSIMALNNALLAEAAI